MCLSLQHPKRPPGNPQQLFLGYGMKITGSCARARKTPFDLIYLPEEGATHMPSLSWVVIGSCKMTKKLTCCTAQLM